MASDLVPLFIPPLSAVLLRAEDEKGAPLDEEEVLGIRDSSAVIMVKREHAAHMAESRGYSDIDPGNCWYDWQMLRRELGREPDLEPGARFSYVRTEDDDFQETIVAARSTLDYFRALIAERADDDAFPLVKVLLSEPQFQAYMWLLVISDEASGFTGEIFELPNDFEHHVVGQQLSIPDVAIQDWMINDNGTLYGGYSLRYSRSKLNADEIAAFDEHIGVERYA